MERIIERHPYWEAHWRIGWMDHLGAAVRAERKYERRVASWWQRADTRTFARMARRQKLAKKVKKAD